MQSFVGVIMILLLPICDELSTLAKFLFQNNERPSEKRSYERCMPVDVRNLFQELSDKNRRKQNSAVKSLTLIILTTYE